jgi:hypothetical protein
MRVCPFARIIRTYCTRVTCIFEGPLFHKLVCFCLWPGVPLVIGKFAIRINKSSHVRALVFCPGETGLVLLSSDWSMLLDSRHCGFGSFFEWGVTRHVWNFWTEGENLRRRKSQHYMYLTWHRVAEFALSIHKAHAKVVSRPESTVIHYKNLFGLVQKDISDPSEDLWKVIWSCLMLSRILGRQAQEAGEVNWHNKRKRYPQY